MKHLSFEQSKHYERLVDIFAVSKIACDVSTTGAGKTVVSLKVAKKLGMPVVIVAPPTLRKTWLTEAAAEEVTALFVSNCALKFSQISSPHMLIVDESHAFKNASNRTAELFQNKGKFRYILFLSATPYDHPRQESIIRNLVGARGLKCISSRVEFTHNTSVNNYLYYVNQTTDELSQYSKGYSLIAQSSSRGDDANGTVFTPAIFCSGLRKIHASLINSLVELVSRNLEKNKLIVCVKFEDHFALLKEIYPAALTLNGSAPMSKRSEIIAKFQKPTWEHSILLLSAAVGGIGIDLDDQHGGFPRKVISLPLFISEYIQLVGRIQRRNTRSDARVYVIQPKRERTYFSSQFEVKSKVLATFGCHITFNRTWDHSDDCVSKHIENYIQISCIATLVGEYCCTCMPINKK